MNSYYDLTDKKTYYIMSVSPSHLKKLKTDKSIILETVQTAFSTKKHFGAAVYNTRLEVLHPRRGAPYVNVKCYS